MGRYENYDIEELREAFIQSSMAIDKVTAEVDRIEAAHWANVEDHVDQWLSMNGHAPRGDLEMKQQFAKGHGYSLSDIQHDMAALQRQTKFREKLNELVAERSEIEFEVEFRNL